MLGTVSRAGELLELFAADAPEWGATRVSKELSITKSQAHEMLVSLEAIGLLRRSPGGRFRLGWKTVSLGQRLMTSEIPAEAARLIHTLGSHARTPVDLVAFDGEACVRIAGYGPSTGWRGAAALTAPTSATSKVILAGMPAQRARELAPGLSADIDLIAVHERGVAFEAEAERRGVAAPVFGQDGGVLAALGITVSPAVWEGRGQLLTKAVIGTAKRLTVSIRDNAPVPQRVRSSGGELLPTA